MNVCPANAIVTRCPCFCVKVENAFYLLDGCGYVFLCFLFSVLLGMLVVVYLKYMDVLSLDQMLVKIICLML